MYLSELCIKRPVGTSLIMLALLFFGAYSYYLIPISQLPDVYFPTIVVSASLPGSSPETMSTSVATPLEKRFATIAGINTITSKSSSGITQITLQFDFKKDIDAAALDVQAAISACMGDLPSNMPYPPVYLKINPGEAPVLYLSMYSDTAPLFVVDDYAQKLFAQNLSMITGVSQVSVYGSQKYATRIQLDPNKLAAYKLSFLDVKNAIAQSNVNTATGSLSGSKQELPIKLNSQIEEIADYQNMVIAFRNGNPIKLHQIGQAIPSVENTKVASWNDDQRSIILFVQRQPGTNTLEVMEKVYKQIEVLKKQLPANIKLVPVYDRSPTIKSAVQDVQHTLFISICLVVVVVFFFLRNIRASLLISIVLILSIVGSFIFLELLGYSFNIISLLALTLVVGFLVDDAIVVLENIARYLEQGKDRLQAALLGVKEISFTVVTITLSLVIVFVPILFIQGIIGKIFHEFGATAIITIMLSGLISLTLTPMLASRFLSLHNSTQKNRFDKFSDNFNAWLLDAYTRSLNFALSKKKYIIYIFWLTIIASVILFKLIPKGFIPDQDLGSFICFTEADPDVSFDAMVTKTKKISDLIRSHQDVASVIYNIGAGGFSQTMNAGSIIVKLKPYAQRKNNVTQIIAQLKPKVNTVPGIRVFLQNFQIIPINSKINKGLYQYVILDPDLNKLQSAVTLLQKNLEDLPEIQDVTNDLQAVTPKLVINIDRDQAGMLGINMQDLANTLYAAFGGAQISNIYSKSDTYKVILEILPEYNKKTFLQNLQIKANNGSLIPISAVANFDFSNEPLTINHQGQVPAATISFNLRAGKSLSQALTAIEAKVKKLSLPSSVSMQFSGAAETFKSTAKNLIVLLFMVIIVIYILLGILYENFIHPLTVLSGLPAAFFGALFTLFIFHLDLDLYGFIGLIILMGIVKKNAIMMIDFALEQQRNFQVTPEQAIYNACLIRFRPIMMTTMAAILGALPVALGIGSVAVETQRSLGVVVMGGLVFSQFLTLYITPVIYLYLSKLERYKY